MLMDAMAWQKRVVGRVITAQVDLGLPREGVLRLGGYTSVDAGITEDFLRDGLHSRIGRVTEDFKLFRIDRPMDNASLGKWLEGMREKNPLETIVSKRFVGATIKQLSAVLDRHPRVGNFSIALPGSMGRNAYGELCVAAFVGYGKYRALRLQVANSIYPEGWLVLAHLTFITTLMK